jgi:hypothetical protein
MITLKNHANINDAAQFARIHIMTAHAQRRLRDENASIAMKIILFNRFNARKESRKKISSMTCDFSNRFCIQKKHERITSHLRRKSITALMKRRREVAHKLLKSLRSNHSLRRRSFRHL